MTNKEIENEIGALGTPSKMPGKATGISAKRCITGAKLVKIPGTPCHSCYALKGNYRFPVTINAHEKRYQALRHPNWVPYMAQLISRSKEFRWFDSGDIQGLWHLENIVAVCRKLPGTKFWLPTQERGILKEYLVAHGKDFPSNLVIRVSSTKVGQAQTFLDFTTSMVLTGEERVDGLHDCPSRSQGDKCLDCRVCWNATKKLVGYHLH